MALVWAGFGLGGEEQPFRPIHGEGAAPVEYRYPEMLISTDELHTLMLETKDSGRPAGGLVVVDARREEEYKRGHIPLSFSIDGEQFQDAQNRPSFLPKAKVLKKLAEELGIMKESRVVVYDGFGSHAAARVWFVFWAYGHEKVAILNGGYNKWKDERRGNWQEGPKKAGVEGQWRPLEDPRGICAFEDLEKYRPRPTPPGRIPPSTLLDARSYGEYRGLDVRAETGGHIPGAVNIPYEGMLVPVTGRTAQAPEGYFLWRPAAEIHAILRGAGIQKGQPLAVYCQTGTRSAHLFFSLRLLGYEPTVLFGGGWREYGNRKDVNVER